MELSVNTERAHNFPITHIISFIDFQTSPCYLCILKLTDYRASTPNKTHQGSHILNLKGVCDKRVLRSRSGCSWNVVNNPMTLQDLRC